MDEKRLKMENKDNDDVPFVWKKNKGRKNMNADNVESELRQVRARREEHAQYLMDREETRRIEATASDSVQYADWQNKEETFHLTQATLRSRIRLVQGRGQLIDHLAKNLFLFTNLDATSRVKSFNSVEMEYQKTLESDMDLKVEHPIKALLQLTPKEAENLLQEMKIFHELETEYGNEEAYWEALMVLTTAKSTYYEKKGIEKEVEEEMKSMFITKTRKELEEMKLEIINQRDISRDEYWDTVYIHLENARAVCILEKYYTDMKIKADEMIKERPNDISTELPTPAFSSSAIIDTTILDDASTVAIAMQKVEEEKGMEEEEEMFGKSDEVLISVKKLKDDLKSQYVPRKPRYYNRVKSGFDWNKYNQTHYDDDNPPPKIIQGYKFNLFYPDLIDTLKPPRFRLEKDEDNAYCILRFTAGAPYEDVAFKIINHEWDYSQRNGFKSLFERGVLHLYFTFKRHRYRR